MLKQFLKINPREVEFDRRGFTCSSPAVQARLENVGRFFLHGYHAALREKDQAALAEKLDRLELEFRGFAYEGAAMALALLDEMSLRGNALSQFMAGPGKQHIYMLHVGAGWAYARLPWLRWRIERTIQKLHPVLRWLAIDGYGFHQGYFYFKTLRPEQWVTGLSDDARHVFYQGLGRSLWFVNGADAARISACITRFPSLYHGDAWSGVGLACTYAGGLAQNAIAQLRLDAGIHASAMAQGAAFAAKARQLAGNPAEHTSIACNVLCQLSNEKAAALCDETFSQIDLGRACPYQHWRELMQQAFLQHAVPQKGQISSSTKIFSRGNLNESSISPSLVTTKRH